MDLKIEYLVVYDISGQYLDNIESFKKLLLLNSSILLINDSKDISYNNQTFLCEIVAHEIGNKNQRLYKLTLSCKENNIDDFSSLLKLIRQLLHKSEGKINVIWDDISTYYSKKAYPKINKIENLLRKLIAFFMVSKLGLDWSEESIPKEVKNNIRNKRSTENFLHNTDFIQLAEILFKPYAKENLDNLLGEIKKNKDLKDKEYEYFEQFIPRSNWERYFSSFVDCEDKYLSKKWDKLYELRCLIAHNSFISKTEYNEIENIVNDLTGKLEDAIISIDKIIIPPSEASSIFESIIKSQDILAYKYLDIWNKIYDDLLSLYKRTIFLTSFDKPLKEILDELIISHAIGPQFYFELNELLNYKLQIFDVNKPLTEVMISNLEQFYFSFMYLKEPFHIP